MFSFVFAIFHVLVLLILYSCGRGSNVYFLTFATLGMRSIHSTQKDFSYTNHGKIKTKIQIHSMVLTFYTILFKVLWPVKLLISIGQKSILLIV
jgi:hypothetical protein